MPRILKLQNFETVRRAFTVLELHSPSINVSEAEKARRSTYCEGLNLEKGRSGFAIDDSAQIKMQ